MSRVAEHRKQRLPCCCVYAGIPTVEDSAGQFALISIRRNWPPRDCTACTCLGRMACAWMLHGMACAWMLHGMACAWMLHGMNDFFCMCLGPMACAWMLHMACLCMFPGRMTLLMPLPLVHSPDMSMRMRVHAKVMSNIRSMHACNLSPLASLNGASSWLCSGATPSRSPRPRPCQDTTNSCLGVLVAPRFWAGHDWDSQAAKLARQSWEACTHQLDRLLAIPRVGCGVCHIPSGVASLTFSSASMRST